MQTLHHYFGCWVVWWYVACLFGGACIVGLWWCWLWSPFCPDILCLDCRIIFTSFTFQPLLYTEMMILPPFFCTYMERLRDKLFHPRQGTHPTLLILPPECYHTIPCQTTSCRTYLTWKMPFHNILTIPEVGQILLIYWEYQILLIICIWPQIPNNLKVFVFDPKY